MYDKLAGMTGTASTEAAEFGDIYGLDVLEIPTNLPVQRIDEDDEVYRTAEEKYRAIAKEIKDAAARGQPILVGTTSIEKSEMLAERLAKDGLKDFQVLNARYHEQEAYIVSQAGVPGAVTIATNMAGRGTDIQLGGNADMRIEHELKDMPEGPERDGGRRRRSASRHQAPEGRGAGRRRPLRPRHRAPRIAAASTTSCAAAPAVRAIPAARSSSCRCRTT